MSSEALQWETRYKTADIAAAEARIKEFIARAKEVSIDEAADRLALPRAKKGAEHAGPCPACGGRDCFSFNTMKNVWNCRAAGRGGHDAIGLAAHVLSHDVGVRSGFLAACEAVTGEAAPDPDRQEPAEDRSARLALMAENRAKSEARARRREAAAEGFRAREIAKARGKWERAQPIGGTDGAAYLGLRSGYAPKSGGLLRFDPALDYWAGDPPVSIHCGPAMIAPFVDAGGAVIGCHQTWIDLSRAGKRRPDLGLDAKGEPWPTKKMRGSKQGGFIPVCNFDAEEINGVWHVIARPSAHRMVAGEGIETVLAVAFAEGFRRDTLYVASGDLGNLAGKADHASDFYHPVLTNTGKDGRARPRLIGGPVPDFDSPAMPVPGHVTVLILLADGDSERVWTASNMARAKARHARQGRIVATVWPGISGDFADLIASENSGGQ